jgi:hypothetical protein
MVRDCPDLSEPERRAILTETPARLFGIDVD